MLSQVTLKISGNLFARAKQLTQVRKQKATDELVDLLDQISAIPAPGLRVADNRQKMKGDGEKLARSSNESENRG